jgi:hypothetical protein
MLHAISLSLKKLKRDTCAVNDRAYASTKKKSLDAFPNTPAIPPHDSKRDIFIHIYELKKTMYSDQTGCFPQVSSLGNMYIMVIHDVDSNSSWAEALKDNTGGKLILAWARALEQMQKAGIVPKHQVLDNQASAAYKKAISDSDMTYELVPLDNHRHNMAKKSHPNIQGPLCWYSQWLCPHFPYAPLVPTSPEGGMATSSPPTIMTPSQLICLYACLWPPQLQQTSICSNRDGGPCIQ